VSDIFGNASAADAKTAEDVSKESGQDSGCAETTLGEVQEI